MKLLRDWVDNWYDRNRDRIFAETESNPKEAHHRFVRAARRIDRLGLSKILLNCPENRLAPGFEISNAAGFNKDGLIPPRFLKYLGFDRVVVGTVTGDSWAGNSGRTIWRYPETWSMVNCEGLPGIGSECVADNLNYFGNHGVPITINLMSTPKKQGHDILLDLEKTVRATRSLPFVDIYQLNVSCPNTHDAVGELDARKRNQDDMDEMIGVLEELIYPHQFIEIKASPDLDSQGVKDTVHIMLNHSRVVGISATNTTTEHYPEYISKSPGKGGGSGDSVYEKARYVQRMFAEEFEKSGSDHYIRACGGNRSPERVRERIAEGRGRVKGIEIYTPLIFVGSKLIKKLRAS